MPTNKLITRSDMGNIPITMTGIIHGNVTQVDCIKKNILAILLPTPIGNKQV